jgi:phenylacetate-CoA ligase
LSQLPIHDRNELEALQLEHLRTLVAELIPGNRFYSSKYAAAAITFDVASLSDFSGRFPFTTKDELVADQSANAPFGTNLTYSLDRYTRFHQTSGTAGSPLRWLDTQESWEWMLENWQRVFMAAGAKPGDRVYFAFSFGPFIGFWLAFESAAKLGMLCIPGGGLSTAARLKAILDNEATILCCTPSYALRLADVAQQENISLTKSRVRRVIVAGEPGGSIPAVRQKIESAWPSAKVFDHHGMTEVGPASYECPSRSGVLHIIETGFYAEVIDSGSTKAVVPGAAGELVLTTLGRFGSPLLRYRTGDLVRSLGKPHSPCACGTFEIALEGGILGRVDDMVIIRGVNVYPSAVDELVRRVEGVDEYRVLIREQSSMPELILEVESRGASSEQVKAMLLHQFEISMGLRVGVNLVPNGSLPRFEMKAKRWVRC